MIRGENHARSEPCETQERSQNKLQKCKEYTIPPNKNIRGMAHAIEDYLMYEEKMSCQVIRTLQGEYIVQAKNKDEGMARWLGLDRSISVKLRPGSDCTVNMTTEGGEWLGKGAVMVAGLLFFKPLALLPGYGIISQACLPMKIDQEIQRYLSSA